MIETINQYTGKLITIILAKKLLAKYFTAENNTLAFKDYIIGEKNLPYQIISEFKGDELNALKYDQLLKYAQPKNGNAFIVLLADFVTTEDGTGIVHIAPSFGSDDNKVVSLTEIVQDGVPRYGSGNISKLKHEIECNLYNGGNNC